MPKWFIGLAILFATLSGVLFGGSSVNATSDWDNSISLTDNIVLDDYANTSQTEDFTLDWYTQSLEAMEITYGEMSPETIMFRNILQVEGNKWAVVKSSDNKTFTVIYTQSPTSDGSVEFISPSNVQISGSGSSSIRYTTFAYVPANPANTITEKGLYVLSLQSFGFNITSPTKVFLSTFPITYPAGYEGEQIPDSYAPPTPPLEWTPKINMVNVVDWKITLQDQNFNTFDNVPFTCDQGLTPVIEYDLYNNDTDPITNISQGVFSPTVPFVFESEKYEVETEYKFIGNYYCGSEEDQPTFSGQTTFYFTVNSAGSYVAPTNSCYGESFPYIDMNGCTGVLEDLLNNLSFGAISFPNWSVNNDSCHSLGIIGDWINIPAHSRTICPQFPEEVRNIITPFVTFVLGLTILGVIITKTKGDAH